MKTPSKRYLFFFKKKIHAGIAFYSTLFIIAATLAYLEIAGLIPYLMLLATLVGIWHLCVQILMKDPNDHLSDLNKKKTGEKQKSIVFFIDK